MRLDWLRLGEVRDNYLPMPALHCRAPLTLGSPSSLMKALEHVAKALLAHEDSASRENMSLAGSRASYSRRWRQVFMAASTYPGGG